MIEAIQDLLEDLTRHPLRTALTSVSVAWGTFILVALLGLGEGLQNSVKWQYRDDATNSIWLYGGQAAMAYDGYPVGRKIVFDDRDIDWLSGKEEVEYLTGRFYAGNRNLVVSYEGLTSTFGVRAVHPDHRFLENTVVAAGRYLDPLDLSERRKVAVIGKQVARFLFNDVDLAADPERILGRWIIVAGSPFRVIGWFEDAGGEGEESEIYLPITTARTVFNGGDRVQQIMFTVGDATVEEAEALTVATKKQIGTAHHIHPKDRRALRVRNNLEDFQRLTRVFDQLATFTWMVGIGTVLAGVVGVGNIMLVSVKERTVEIGLRKALGETPTSIVIRIVREAVLLTGVSGYAGVVAGVAVVEAVAEFMPENDTLRDPSVALPVALAAAAFLTLAGAIAGFIPAYQAATVRPVDALRGEV